jgi:hypothetical protein
MTDGRRRHPSSNQCGGAVRSRVHVNNRRRNYECPLGEVFNGLGEYLDECCLANSTSREGCLVWQQCRNWWDEYCTDTCTHLTLTEMKEIIDRFEKTRHKWLRRPASVSLSA